MKHHADDLFHAPLDQAEINFDNEGGETYLCGNPPYKGNADQTKQQKDDIRVCFSSTSLNWKSLDYICGWFWKAKEYLNGSNAKFAFVSTNSVSQGQNISFFWKEFLGDGLRIEFAERSFLWRNLATNNAGVTVVIIGCSRDENSKKRIFDQEQVYLVENINPYLVSGGNVFVDKMTRQLSGLPKMVKGNYYGLSDGLLMPYSEKTCFAQIGLDSANLKTFKGGAEIVRGTLRACFWFPEKVFPVYALSKCVLESPM